MKNKLLLSILLFAFITLPIVSSAEEINAEIRLKAKADLEARKEELESKREDIKKEIESRKENIRKEIEEKRESIKNEVEERRENAIQKIQERLKEFVEKIIERSNAAIERLEKIAERIDARIAKMEAENIDVTEAKDLLAIAKIKIETAKTSVSEISVESEIILSNNATTTVVIKNDFQDLKNQIEKAKKDLKEAHAALVDVIENLKPGDNKLKNSATSTATTTNNN